MRRLFVLAVLLASVASLGCRQGSLGLRRRGKSISRSMWRAPSRLRAPRCTPTCTPVAPAAECNGCPPAISGVPLSSGSSIPAGTIVPSGPIYGTPVPAGSIPTQPIDGQIINEGVIDGAYYEGSMMRPTTTIHTGRVVAPRGFDALQVEPPARIVGPESSPIGS